MLLWSLLRMYSRRAYVRASASASSLWTQERTGTPDERRNVQDRASASASSLCPLHDDACRHVQYVEYKALVYSEGRMHAQESPW